LYAFCTEKAALPPCAADNEPDGTWHTVDESETHKVLCTDAEFEKWGLGK
jgi:hypothetical protein